MKKQKKIPGCPTVLTGRDAWIARLKNGESVSFREGGNSMTPRIKSRQKCTYVPVQRMSDIAVGDAVFCRVGSSYFTHLVTAIKGDQVQSAIITATLMAGRTYLTFTAKSSK